MLGVRPGDIESYRLLPQLGVLPCDRGKIGDPPWLLHFITVPHWATGSPSVRFLRLASSQLPGDLLTPADSGHSDQPEALAFLSPSCYHCLSADSALALWVRPTKPAGIIPSYSSLFYCVFSVIWCIFLY